MHSRTSLQRDLLALGLAPGDTVMVHASVRAVGPVAGGPDQIHLAIKDAIGAEGSLLMYASCPDGYDEVGRGTLSPEVEAELLEKLPPFDASTARSARDNGALVEMLRTWPGSRVNDHVARFVAWGARAAHLFAEQPWNYAFGAGSALERFVELRGRILLLGSDHDQVTFLHYPEHVADFPDKRVARYQVPVLERGARVWRWMEEVDTSDAGAHAHWPPRFFARIVDGHLRAMRNTGGPVGDATSFLIDARALLDHALSIMTQLAHDDRFAEEQLSEENG
ncbi:MAG: aminoglycoside 3-N-acetyltransferase [Gemmatimonadetes bacterium]|nr:MAG: aminoglycoside 3-N-acetyltransferase [Gemmatimonadota bacterium]